MNLANENGIRISELDLIATIKDNDSFPIVDSGEIDPNKDTKRLTIQQLRNNINTYINTELSKKLELENIKSGENITITKTGNDITISSSDGSYIDGKVKTVNQIESDENGNIELTSSNILYIDETVESIITHIINNNLGLEEKIGDISKLPTENKTNIVDSMIEIKDGFDAHLEFIESFLTWG